MRTERQGHAGTAQLTTESRAATSVGRAESKRRARSLTFNQRPALCSAAIKSSIVLTCYPAPPAGRQSLKSRGRLPDEATTTALVWSCFITGQPGRTHGQRCRCLVNVYKQCWKNVRCRAARTGTVYIAQYQYRLEVYRRSLSLYTGATTDCCLQSLLRHAVETTNQLMPPAAAGHLQATFSTHVNSASYP